MYSATARANTIFTFSCTVLSVILILTSVSTYFENREPDVKFKINAIDIRSLAQNDVMTINFDLNTDMNKLFTWNTKQFFVYLFIEYNSTVYEVNEIVFWDVFFNKTEEAVLYYPETTCEYELVDKGHNFRNKSYNVYFAWNETPWSGLLSWKKKLIYSSTFPDQYSATFRYQPANNLWIQYYQHLQNMNEIQKKKHQEQTYFPFNSKNL